jgi:hypothetical protein
LHLLSRFPLNCTCLQLLTDKYDCAVAQKYRLSLEELVGEKKKEKKDKKSKKDKKDKKGKKDKKDKKKVMIFFYHFHYFRALITVNDFCTVQEGQEEKEEGLRG